MKAGLQQIDLILVMNVETLLACCGKLRVEIKQMKNKKINKKSSDSIEMQFQLLSSNQFNSIQLYLYNSSYDQDSFSPGNSS